MSEELFCPNILMSCPKYPYKCCYECKEQETCRLGMRCYKSPDEDEIKGRGFSEKCRKKYGLTKTQLIYGLIFGEEAINDMLEEKENEY